MDGHEITKIDKGFRIEGFPDAVKLVRIEGPKAKRLADLALHCVDLEFSANCLAAIETVGEKPSVVQIALWRCSVIHFMKCFGGSESRFQLNSSTVFKGHPPEALENFEYFANFRNKHLVHDENAYAQSLPGAVINPPTKNYKIEKIVSFCAIADVLDFDRLNNLKLLIQTTHQWVVAQYDTLSDLLTTELEAETYDSLIARQELKYSKPTVEDMGESRKPA